VKYYDISSLISPRTAVFPGDVPFSREISLDFKKGDHLLLSAMRTTFHIGAHADSVSHYHADGKGIEHRKLEAYFGDCQVIEVKKKSGERIYVNDLEQNFILAPRVLFKTNSFPNSEKWNPDFNSLSPELINYLADQKVIMVGIDTPSVDPETSKMLESHQALHQRRIAVLEGLSLGEVPPGVYKLVALPLRIENADASPVRAILIQDQHAWKETGLQEI
jgi:arylformamidase